MKGLLLKDLALLKGQKKFFAVVIILAIGTAFATEDITFILGYVTLIIPMFALSSLSYDEIDNGHSFLFTLPVSRSMYIVEKYCFALLLGVGAVVLAMVLTGLMGMVQGQLSVPEMLAAVGGVFALMLILQSVLMPLQVKFGAEKGRLAMLAVGGVAGAVGFLGVKLMERAGVDMVALMTTIENLGTVAISAILFVVVAAVMLLSMGISISIMNKKQF